MTMIQSSTPTITPSVATQASDLANQYVSTLYLNPTTESGEPNIKPLLELLKKSEIIWIRNDEPTELTLEEMTEKLMKGYYINVKEIQTISMSVFSDGMSPRAESQTIQVGVSPYQVNSTINFTVKKDDETDALYIYSSQFK
jgi:hypothetical protein